MVLDANMDIEKHVADLKYSMKTSQSELTQQNTELEEKLRNMIQKQEKDVTHYIR